jgi:hypothetical protein
MRSFVKIDRRESFFLMVERKKKSQGYASLFRDRLAQLPLEGSQKA